MMVYKNTIVYFILVFLQDVIRVGGIFYGSNLAGFVRAKMYETQCKRPMDGSVLRKLRMLKERGVVEYETVNALESLYRVKRVAGYTIRDNGKNIKVKGVGENAAYIY